MQRKVKRVEPSAIADGTISLRAYLRGRVRFEAADGTKIQITSKKGRALLAYLCRSDDGSASRRELTKLLWTGAADDQRADRSLREELRNLRKPMRAVGCNIEAVEFKSLKVGPGKVWVDIGAELAALPAGRACPTARVDARGELLADLEGVTDEFDDWIVSQRHQLQKDRLQLLSERVADAKARPKAPDERIAATHALFDAEPTAEDVCQELIALLRAAGKFAAARRVFERHETALADIDETPSPQTRLALKGNGALARPTANRPVAVEVPPVAAPEILGCSAGVASRPQHHGAAVTADEAILVGVLPVRNMTGDTAFDRVADNLTTELLTDFIMLLGPFTVVELPPVMSALTQELASRCKYVVVQNLQMGRANGTVVARLNIRLLRGRDTSGAAAYRTEHPLDTLPENHTAITNQIASQIRLDLIMDVGRRLHGAPIESMSARELTLQGQAVMRMRNTLNNVTAARALFAASLVRDPFGVDALVGVGHTCHRLASQPSFSDRPREDIRDGRAAVDTALTIDPGHVMANHVSGMLRSVEGDPEGAALDFERIRTRTHYAPALAYSAYNRVFMNQPNLGLKSIEQLIDKSPHDASLPIYCFFAGVAEFHCGNYANARGWLAKSLSHDPSYGSAQIWLAGSQYVDGHARQAEASFATFRAHSPEYTRANFEANWGCARSSNPQYLSRTQVLADALTALELPQV
jgi:DNA-binding SARP family transcriptional activator